MRVCAQPYAFVIYKRVLPCSARLSPALLVQVEQALLWSPIPQANLKLYRDDYVKLFVDTVRTAYLQTAPWLNFVDTSPSSGLASLEPYVKRCAQLCCAR